MQSEWTHIDELDDVIADTKLRISECKEEIAKLESNLSWLNEERVNFLDNITLKKKEKVSITSKPHSFNLQRRNLPIVPVRQLSESGVKLSELPVDSFVSKSSATSFGSTTSLISKNCTSVEDISPNESNSPSRTSSTKGHKFSTYDLKFLKKLTSYAKYPSKWNGSNPKLSISSMDEILSESCNSIGSITTSTDDLDVEKSLKHHTVSSLSLSNEHHKLKISGQINDFTLYLPLILRLAILNFYSFLLQNFHSTSKPDKSLIYKGDHKSKAYVFTL